MGTSARRLLVLAAALVAGSGLPGGARADGAKVKAWLETHYAAHPITAADWRLSAIEQAGSRVLVFVLVPEDQMLSILWLDAPRPLRIVAGIACPARDAPVWTMLEKDEAVAIVAAADSHPETPLVDTDCQQWTP